MQTVHHGCRCVLLVAIAAISFAANQAEAQSIRIQSGGYFGGFQLGIHTGPSFGYGSRFGHGFGDYGYGRFGYPVHGIGYGVGFPYSAHRYGYPSLDETYRAQSMYRDYRADYYDRLMGSYLYGIQRDLVYELPRYQSFHSGPVIALPLGYPSLEPPVAQIEPLFDQLENQAFAPELSPEFAPNVPVVSLPESLRAAATRLSVSLSRRHNDGEIWLDYLSPGKIIQAIDQGLPAESLRELARSYDGVVGNPELRSVANTDGFAKTRQLLHQWLDSIDLDATDLEEPASEESILDEADEAPVDKQGMESEGVKQVPDAPKPRRVRVSV